ncbi:MAG: type I pullulanase [Bacteroidales bacterium]|nr:type I pullulanase [Bacteroidales bacterium]
MRNQLFLSSMAIVSSALISLSGCSSNNINEGTSNSSIASYEDYPVKSGSLDEMVYSPKKTSFSVWAPTADAVKVFIYESGNMDTAFTSVEKSRIKEVEATDLGKDAIISKDMKRQKDGSWTVSIKKDLMNKFYTFSICSEGKWLRETPGINAKAVGLNGRRAAIIDMSKTNPEGWDSDIKPELKSFSDVIIYEIHHRDFTMDADNGIVNKGKFLAYTETGTTNSNGYATGVDHLKEMGITHIHILPSFDSDGDEVKNAYNWGYDPLNYNVPEGKYSLDAADPYSRIREFKMMVKSLHENGIRVILDVVYNHTSTTGVSNFDLTAPGYFYRHKENGAYSDASGCGNETASEREMMRKYMIESVKYWINEYHIDGFRFDLMGIHDIETMNQIRAMATEIDPSILIYGEGWTAGTSPLSNDVLAVKANTAKMPGIAAFGDEMRDAVRGPYDDDKVGTFLVGNPGNEESIKFGIVGAIKHPDIDYSIVNYSKEPWATEPTQMIAYVSCHDDMNLRDRIVSTLPKADESKRLAAQKLAETIVLTSQGIPFIFAGDEIVRDKKGVHNSYKSPDSVNTIPWENKTKYNDVYSYVQKLISIRKAHPAFHMGSADAVRKNIHFLDVDDTCQVAFSIDGAAAGDSWKKIIVAFNGSLKKTMTLELPKGSYNVICKDGEIDMLGLSTFIGESVKIAPTSAVILVTE